MQKDEYTEFDLELKRMLHDAEEEVPSRVWDAVSSELDRLEGRKVVARRRWWYAAAAVAAAAAVMSGIFIFPGHDGQNLEPGVTAEVTESVQSPSEALQDAVPTIEEQIASAGNALADVPARPVRSAVPGTVPSAVVPASALEGEALETAPEAAEAAQEAAQEAPAQPGPAAQATPAATGAGVSSTGIANDPFAWPEEEEQQAGRRRISYSLAGNAMTNDFTGNDIHQMRAPANGVRTRTGVEEKGTSTFAVPFTLSLGLRYPITDRWSVGTGLTWTRLTKTFNGIYTEVNGSNDIVRSINSEIVNDLHYVGIPVNLYYNIFDSRNLRFYVWGGGSAEKGVTNRFRILSDAGDIFYKQSVDGIQWSAGAGLGIEFLVGNHFGLYFDPSARYYFDCGQPSSIRTSRPFMIDYEVGIRFNL